MSDNKTPLMKINIKHIGRLEVSPKWLKAVKNSTTKSRNFKKATVDEFIRINQ